MRKGDVVFLNKIKEFYINFLLKIINNIYFCIKLNLNIELILMFGLDKKLKL